MNEQTVVFVEKVSFCAVCIPECMTDVFNFRATMAAVEKEENLDLLL